jgi:hypothetical protein
VLIPARGPGHPAELGIATVPAQCVNRQKWQISLKRLVLPLFGLSAIQVASRPGLDLRQDAYSHLPLLEAIRKHDPEANRRAFEIVYDAWSAGLLEPKPADKAAS